MSPEAQPSFETTADVPIESSHASKERQARHEKDRTVFGLESAADDELVKQYQPRYLARGGQQVVYDIPGHPDVVVKADAVLLKFILQDNGLVSTLQERIAEDAQAILQARRRQYREMVAAFGQEHVAQQRQFLMKVPVTPEILRGLYGKTMPRQLEGVREAWTIVTVQKRVAEIGGDHIDLSTGYLEKRVSNETYDRISKAFLVDRGPGEEGPAVHWQEIADAYPSLRPLFEKMEELARQGDFSLEMALDGFLRDAFRYVEEKGKALDMVGKDNIILAVGADGKWRQLLVDAMYPILEAHRLAHVSTARTILEELASGERAHLSRGYQNIVLNVVNFMRTLNILGARVDPRHYFVGLMSKDTWSKLDLHQLLSDALPVDEEESL